MSVAVPEPGARDEPVHICLSMIARDEADVIERCLASCLPLLDALCVCDTGSSDGTPDLVERFGRTHALPVAVHRHAWQDFGTNRNLAIEAARASVDALGWRRDHTFLLFLDADQVLDLGPGLDKEALDADVYALRQRSGNERYWNSRLARATVDVRYIGATHEYLSVPDDARQTRLSGPCVVDHDDGGARQDKFERDRDLLEAALADDPADPRTLFYLARTYRALGDPIRAISLFRRRVEVGGWSEEVWHALFAAAEILMESGELDAARAALLDARRTEPRRAEALHLLARVHRTAGRPRRAAAAAHRGLALPYPDEQSLFVDRTPYAHGLREELALSAASTRHHEQGLLAADALLVDRDVPADVKERVHPALPSYVAPWPDATYTELRPSLPAPYVPCNPSIVRRPDGYLVNCRAVNYRQRDARDYEIRDPAHVVRTRNVLMSLSLELEPLSELKVRGAGPAPRVTGIRGFEDMRLLDTPEGLFGIATTTDRHPSGLTGPSLVSIDGDGRVHFDRPVTGYREDLIQKNWLPFLDSASGAPRLLYALDPWVVLALDTESGACRPVEEATLPISVPHWRNSAGPLPFETSEGRGVLVVSHEVPFLPGGRRRYLHRFVWVSDDRTRVLATRPFFFRTLGIEFAGGMCLAQDDATLLVSLGVEDSQAWLAGVPEDAVRARLRPMPAVCAPSR